MTITKEQAQQELIVSIGNKIIWAIIGTIVGRYVGKKIASVICK